MSVEQPKRPNSEREADAERGRLYNLGALAQSYPPKGVADLLNVPKSRPHWGERPLRERVTICALLAIEAALAGLVIAGVATRDAALVFAGVGLLLFLLLGAVVLTVRSERKRDTAGDGPCRGAPPKAREPAPPHRQRH